MFNEIYCNRSRLSTSNVVEAYVYDMMSTTCSAMLILTSPLSIKFAILELGNRRKTGDDDGEGCCNVSSYRECHTFWNLLVFSSKREMFSTGAFSYSFYF